MAAARFVVVALAAVFVVLASGDQQETGTIEVNDGSVYIMTSPGKHVYVARQLPDGSVDVSTAQSLFDLKDTVDGLLTRVSDLETKLNGPDGLGGVAATVATLNAQVGDADTGLAKVNTRVTDLETAVSEPDGKTGLTEKLSAVDTRVGTLETEVQTADTGLKDKVAGLESTQSGLVSDVAALTTDVNDPTVGLKAKVSQQGSDISDLETTQGGLVTDVTTLKADVNDGTTGLKVRMSAAETTQGGLVTDVNTLKADVNTASTGLKDRVSGLETKLDGLESTQEDLAATQGDLVADVNTLKSDVNTAGTGLKAMVSSQGADIDDLQSAQSTLQADVAGLKTDVDTAGTGLKAKVSSQGADIDDLQNAQTTLVADVAGLKSDVGNPTTGLDAVNTAASGLLSDVASLKAFDNKHEYTSMHFTRDCDGKYRFVDEKGQPHIIPSGSVGEGKNAISDPAADGSQKLAYRHTGHNGQPTFLFNIEGAVSIACSIIGEEDDSVRSWFLRTATDSGNDGTSKAAWGTTGISTFFVVPHSLSCSSSGVCSDNHPFTFPTCISWRILCFA
eukprot:m.389820 g.389820  ORF g.389820 m.389820 type:complete len:562 (-) comp20072_c0_seq28:188-1873(-)